MRVVLMQASDQAQRHGWRELQSEGDHLHES